MSNTKSSYIIKMSSHYRVIQFRDISENGTNSYSISYSLDYKQKKKLFREMLEGKNSVQYHNNSYNLDDSDDSCNDNQEQVYDSSEVFENYVVGNPGIIDFSIYNIMSSVKSIFCSFIINKYKVQSKKKQSIEERRKITRQWLNEGAHLGSKSWNEL